MERESFEDQEVADILNNNFVSIKVDREERPDIDHIYMQVCQSLTGHGGWPLTIIMTPETKPFFAATYLPKNDLRNMMGLVSLLDKIKNLWTTKKQDLIESSENIMNLINKPEFISEEELDISIIHDTFNQFKRTFDGSFGGFGRAPKFPTPHNLFFLLRYYYNTKNEEALEMVEKTLDSMQKGGIFDHIGYGFSRYSTDPYWLVPHFEKMLYDNALLAIAYLETYHLTKKEQYANTASKVLDYVLRDMTSPDGGFYSAEDADSEGEEGTFYLWTIDEITNAIGMEEGNMFSYHFDITPEGNFEGKNIPNLIENPSPIEANKLLEKHRETLFKYREKRVHPYKDDKILTSWNGLMIAAMSMAGRILGSPKYTQAAIKAYEFINTKLVRPDGRLLARYRDGEAAFPAYADDYSYVVWGLTELYETTYKPDYLKRALELNEDLLKYFWDSKEGGLFVYGSDSEKLISRPKEIYDGATPSANSVSALNFLRLARLTGRFTLENKAYQILKAFSGTISSYPAGHAFSIIAIMFSHFKTKEIIIVSDLANKDSENMINTINDVFNPFSVSLFAPKERNNLESFIPFLKDYETRDGKATAYVCENFSCKSPVTSSSELRELLSN